MNRRGKSLVELLVIISVLSVVMALSATTLIATLHTERQIRRDIEQQTTLARLARQWRADAHAATAAQVDVGCQFTLSGGETIRYSFESPRIVRLVERDKAILHRDAFVLPAGAIVRFEAPEDQAGRLVRLVIGPGEEPGKRFGTAIRPAQMEAAVGMGGMGGVRP